MTTELLEQRLRDLSVGVPDAGRVSARALAPAHRWRRWPTVALGSIAALTLAAVVAYFVPATGTVVAKMPVAGDVLNVGDRVTVVGATTSSSGYRVTLVAAYADETRTELKLLLSPAAMIGPGAAITDQFGRTYGATSSDGDLLSGEVVADFEPLAWPDSVTGARITIRITEIEPGPDPSAAAVRGSWMLHATLGVDEGTLVAPPAPMTLGRAHVRFKSVIYTPASVAVNLEITGIAPVQLDFGVPDPSKLNGTGALTLDVLDPDGNSVLGSSSSDSDWFGVTHVHMLGNRHGSGRYSIVVGYRGAQATRTFVVS